MKPEPLKDKICYTQGDIFNKPRLRPLDLIEVKIFLPYHIKSAVEWLGEEISKMFVGDLENTRLEDRIKRKIDKAFKDVIKLKTGGQTKK